MLLIAPLSGCFGSDDKKTDDGDKKDSNTGDGNGTAAVVVAPVASLKVLIDGNETAANATSGTIDAKVGVNVTFDASNTTGDDVVFAWDFGDGETIGEIPATNSTDGNSTGNSTGNATVVMPILNSLFFQEGNQTNATGNASTEPTDVPENMVVEHAFAEAGAYNVTLYATNSAGTSSATVSVLVATSGPPPGTFIREDKQAFGSTAASTYTLQGCGTTFTKEWVIVDTEADGTKSAVKWVNVSMAAPTGTQSGGYTKLALKDPSGAILKENNAGITAKTISVPGPLPAGKYKVEAAVCATTIYVNVGATAVSGVATYVTA